MQKALFLFILSAASTTLRAQNGVLDPSFLTNGLSIIDIDNSDNASRSMVLQPDGKILLGGYATTLGNNFNVLRLNTDGSLDASFGSNGSVSTTFESSSIATSIALQNDGKIVAAGHSWGGEYNEFTLTRYNSNGTLDATFGNSGTVTTAFSLKSGIGKSVVIQNDGKIILAGYAYSDFNDFDDFAIARYNPDGTLDTTFGNEGLVFTNFGPSMDWINSAVLQSDGKLVVGGFSANKMALARYLTTGSLDPTFGVNGLVTTTITTASQAIINGLALTPDAIYACGFSIDAYGNSTLVKYDYAGNVALDFGENGILINNLGGIDLYKDIKVKNNKLVVGGTINTDGIFNFSLSQFELNGDPVLSFGTNGVFTVAPTNFINGLESIAIQSDGKILAAGVCQDFPRDIAIVRVVSNTLVSVDEDQPENDLVIYPNPTPDFIKINGSIAKELTQIMLTDAQGKVLYQVPTTLSTSEKEWIIDLSNHASGSYFLTLQSKAGSTIHQVVKK